MSEAEKKTIKPRPEVIGGLLSHDGVEHAKLQYEEKIQNISFLTKLN